MSASPISRIAAAAKRQRQTLRARPNVQHSFDQARSVWRSLIRLAADQARSLIRLAASGAV